jgi:hypothetical protein
VQRGVRAVRFSVTTDELFLLCNADNDADFAAIITSQILYGGLRFVGRREAGAHVPIAPDILRTYTLQREDNDENGKWCLAIKRTLETFGAPLPYQIDDLLFCSEDVERILESGESDSSAHEDEPRISGPKADPVPPRMSEAMAREKLRAIREENPGISQADAIQKLRNDHRGRYSFGRDHWLREIFNGLEGGPRKPGRPKKNREQ